MRGRLAMALAVSTGTKSKGPALCWAEEAGDAVGPNNRMDDGEASPENESGCEMPRSVDSVILELDEQRAWLEAELDEQQTWIQECDIQPPTGIEMVAGGTDVEMVDNMDQIQEAETQLPTATQVVAGGRPRTPDLTTTPTTSFSGGVIASTKRLLQHTNGVVAGPRRVVAQNKRVVVRPLPFSKMMLLRLVSV